MMPPPPFPLPPPTAAPYLIFGSDLQVVQLHVQPGEVVLAEPGCFCYCSSGVEMDTRPRDGFLGGINRMLAGENFFTNQFVNRSSEVGYIGFAAPHPGKILPVDLRTKGSFVCQPDAYLCSKGEVRVQAKVVSLETGLLGGDGFFMQRVSGTGTAFIHAGGSVIEKVLQPREVIRVNSGCILAISESCTLTVEYVGNLRVALFGGRGIFTAKITGPGTAYLQSLPLPRLSSRIIMSASGGRDALAFPALRCFRLLLLLSVIIVLMLMLHTLVVLISLEEPDL